MARFFRSFLETLGLREDETITGGLILGRGPEGLPVRVAILSADYHLFRALHLAEKLTGAEYCGIASKSDPVMFAHFVTRECIAIVKDKFFGRL